MCRYQISTYSDIVSAHRVGMLVVCEAPDPAKAHLYFQTQSPRKVHATMLSVNARHTGLPAPTHSAAMSYGAMNSVKQINGALQRHHHRHMWIITGPAGCGKSTVAQYLANKLSIPYIEGDDVCYTLTTPMVFTIVANSVFSTSSIHRQISRRWLRAFLSLTRIAGIG